MATTDTFTKLERDTELWFFDGNVVLITQGNVAFRVHKGVLALHAEFFAGMFQDSLLVPHGPNGEETIEGCPIIPLDDPAYDIRQFLLVMYRKRYLKTAEDTTFPVLAALMRVGDKYGAHDLLHECMPQVRQMKPECLLSVKCASEYRSTIKFAPHHAVEALHLCRVVGPLTEEPDILIWMLFLCAQLDEHDLRHGTTRADGTPEKLSDADIQQILALKDDLQQRGADALDAVCSFRLQCGFKCEHDEYEELWNNPDAGPGQCCEEFDKQVISMIPQEAKDAYLRGDPFESWVIDKMYEVEESCCMCAGCFNAMFQTLFWLRKDCWDELPTLAGIDDDIDWEVTSLG
ncbi:hypothetical protein OH76DRAFT_1560862 [Lentinus brumalis]|uniref:BTB domain-containing protein n=1 Tax=Lentinus brumalis TaxID=2498619 RepID=A0A371CQP0_9APHY|nr:hypothetical protein OH76DRAFT_1560862 [Polyporus brumalis]